MNTAKPLEGIKVLDLTQFLSGPYATMILADLGAEVIKVESPQGDSARSIPPHFVGEDSAYYLSINRNKRSVVVDMKQDKGRQIVNELASKCDVLIENFRPGVISKLGLSYEKLSTINPRLIWCSISGFGQDGPYRDFPAYDMIVQALSGGMSLTGDYGGLPVRSGVPLGDLSAGMFSVIGIQSALVERERTGTGRQIDIAMLDCQISMLCYQAAYHLISGVVPGTQGRGHDSIPTYRAFVASDAVNVVVCANTQRMWEEMANELGLKPLIDDPRFRSNADRYENRELLWPLLDEAFALHPSSYWIERFRARSIPVGVVNGLDKALSDPQVKHRNMVLDLENPSLDQSIRVAGNPIKFNGVTEGKASYPPRLGADTRMIISKLLGIDPIKLNELFDSGVLVEPPSLASKA